MATGEEIVKASPADQLASPWVAALGELREWDPAWAELAVKITTNPWTDGVLPRKFIELVSVGLNASRTNLNPEGTRRHIRAALAAGAHRQEILMKVLGHRNEEWDSLLFLDPVWTDQYMAMCSELRRKRLASQAAGTTAHRIRRGFRAHLWSRYASSHQERIQGRRYGRRNYGSSEARLGAGCTSLQPWRHYPCRRTGAQCHEPARKRMSR
jgi:hypothetical protein